MQFSVLKFWLSLKRLSCALLVPLVPITAHSAVLAYDTFDDYDSSSQSVNSLYFQNSGIGLRGYWDAMSDNFYPATLYKVVSPGISGTRGVHIVADDWEYLAVRRLDEPITEGRTVYIRAEIKPSAFVTGTSRFGIKLVFGGLEMTVGMIGDPYLTLGGTHSTTRIAAGTTYFLVVKVELLPGKDRFSLYNITSLSTTEPEPIAVAYQFNYGNLTRIGFDTRSATVSYDSLVVADTFSEVIFPSLPMPPKISHTLPIIIEGNAGTNDHTISLNLSEPSSLPVRFFYRTFPSFFTAMTNYARHGEDLPELSGEIIFPPGSTTQTLNLPIYGDLAWEPEEKVPLEFYHPVNAAFTGTAAKIEANLLIKNDDTTIVQPNLTIQRQTNGFVIQWNAGSGGDLEYTEQFPPTSGWKTVSPVTVGQIYSAVLPLTANPRYFRTRK